MIYKISGGCNLSIAAAHAGLFDKFKTLNSLSPFTANPYLCSPNFKF
jgi:hypothetical protein